MTVPPNAHVALVGPSGAGKSTVFALIERFYNPDDGTIAIDGHDIGVMCPTTLRGLIGYVQQESPLLYGSLRDNIRYAAPGATDADIDRVVRQANLDDLVRRLPEGLDTEVGEGGSLLSGVERQRGAIARALLAGPRLLLLDEPTSQLDAPNEESLAEVVRSLAGSCTVLTVAHRIAWDSAAFSAGLPRVVRRVRERRTSTRSSRCTPARSGAWHCCSAT